MCKASKEEKSAYANEQKISNLMTSQFQKFAGDNSAILHELTHNLTPIQDAGPSQFGLSPAEEAAERTMTAEQLTAAGANATNAVRQALASKGGGTTYLPSGSEASILGSLAQDSAVKEALAQSQITQRGYDIGRQNWEFATEGLTKAPGALEAPVISAGEGATGAAKNQFEGAQAITAANQAWMQPVAGIIGGVASGLTGGVMGGGSKGGGGGPAKTSANPTDPSGGGWG